MLAVEPEGWATLLGRLDGPSVEQLAEALADARDVSVERAREAVEDAIDGGPLTFDPDAGTYGAVRLTGDCAASESVERDERRESGGDGWEAILDRAQAIAGREWWEPVEEDALAEALADAGHADLLAHKDGLARIDRWKRADLSDEGEEPDVRWYYARGDEPRVEEFRRFHDLLTSNAPEGYRPWYFRVERAGKAPDTKRGSWKEETARLTVREAVQWLKDGGNVGVAGRPDDPLVNIDIDDGEETTPEDLPDTLRARSRSRCGWHGWGFNPEGDIPNLPTDDLGEVRTDWQYVVAPGSFVASAAGEIPDGADSPGYYTVEHEAPVATIEYDDLPKAFREWEDSRDEVEEVENIGGRDDRDEVEAGADGKSAVFDVEAEDLLGCRSPEDRFTSIFHDSTTSANMSVKGGKLHCWRHNVAHGGLQALAVLSQHSPTGDSACRSLGKGHTYENNRKSNAGPNAYKGDWRLIWWAWDAAKDRGNIPDDDPIPYRVLVNLAVRDELVDREDLVERDSETGEVVETPEDHEGDTYTALPPGTYNDALDHVREEYGRDPGRDPVEYSGGEEDGEEYRTDPREVEVVIEPKRAWDAAGRVTPGQLDGPLGLDTTEDGKAWVCPATGGRVADVARAVAIDEGDDTTAETPLREEYARAYARAREHYGAPLPRYLTHSDTVERFDYVLGAIRELTFWHLDEDALTVEITGRGDDVGGDAELTLDPSPADGWRDSESGESVLVFESGTVWDADGNDGDGQVIDALRFVALDGGIIEDADARLQGEAFTEAYRVARDEYGAPLPRWNPGQPAVTPVLPPAEDLVEEPEPDGDELGRLRADVESLHRELAEGDGVAVNRALPALGKTTAAIKAAADIPTTYLAPRKELMAQAAETAEEHGVTCLHLPIFSDASPARETLDDAVAHVREHGKDTLRQPWGVLDAVGGDVWPEADDEDEDAVEIDRPTCPTAEGDHGDAWALAVHVARELDYAPRDIHERASALFGRPLPCQDGDCAYSDGWDAVADPDAPVDLLIGHYVHAHVESARTYYQRREERRGVKKDPRALVIDEYPGLAYTETFDDEALDHAVWLAGALCDDVEDRQDLTERDLWGDELVRAWLDGAAGFDAEGPLTEVDLALLSRRKALAAAVAAEEILDRYPDLLDDHGLRGPLRQVRDDVNDLDAPERDALAGDILDAVVGLPEDVDGRQILRWIEEDVGGPLRDSATWGMDIDADAIPEGELRAFVERAIETAEDRPEDGQRAVAMLDAARDAVRGGDDGARELAVWADDGYAHRKAHYLLEAAIRPADAGAVNIETSEFTFGDRDETTLKRLAGDVLDAGSDKATVIFDRNHHGAEIHDPPSRRSGGGDECPVVGLDATARGPLWRVALGEAVAVRDVHDSDRERAECLREVHRLQLVQASDIIRSYEGDPESKNLDRDVALLEEIADRFAGVHAARGRDGENIQVDNPAALTTKGVREVLEADDRLDDVVDTWAHYGNVKGSNDLGEHDLAALLGCQHYGDDAVERFAAIAGEEVERSGWGTDLDYGGEVANTYLKHMREDQVMQAALRFTRGGSGALVFAHTAALRPDLPVVGEAQVLETWSDTATEIAETWRRHPGETFTAADVADAVDVGKRQVRRILAEFVDAGYLDRHDPGEGRANVHTPTAQPSAGEVDIGPATPQLDTEAGQDGLEETYTANVRVTGVNSGEYPRLEPPSPSLPSPDAPETASATGPPG